MTTLEFGSRHIDLATPVALLLALAAAFAIVRLVVHQWRAEPAQRCRGWRLALLVLAQPLGATLLYFALLPLTAPGEAGTLVVASAGATSAQIAAAKGDARVALPEAPSLPGIDRVPDLAAALRRHPGTRRVRVIGGGLEARDRDAVVGLSLDFKPAPLPRGLVELDAPSTAVPGGTFRVDGRVHDLPGGFAELLDPGHRRVDRVALSRDGRFSLSGTSRIGGAAVFSLRLRNARQQVVENVDLPMQVDAPAPPRVLMLAGAPGPEVKFLRRWAHDAGLPMHAQIAVGGGMQLGDAPIALDVANLARFDVVVLDERAWSALGEAQRAALVEAVRGGLGMLLRVTAPLSHAERRRLRALGFTVGDGRGSETFRLDQSGPDDDALRARLGPGTRDAPRPNDAPPPSVPALSRRAVDIASADGLPLLRGKANALIGAWRAEGRGRIAVWTLTDSYRLVLAGRSDLHGELWSDALGVLSRPRQASALTLEGERLVGERLALCGVSKDAYVAAPAGAVTPLRVDPLTGARACAAFWPTGAGWHRVQAGDHAQLFHVRPAGEASGLHAHAVREATLRLAATGHAAARASATAAPPRQAGARQAGARWPWWLAWLLVSAAVWWLERSRVGRVS